MHKNEIQYLKAYIVDNEGLCSEAAKIGIFINNKYPLFIGNDIHEGRDKADLRILSKIKGNKYVMLKEEILKIYDQVYKDLVILKERFGIDYTNQRDKILGIVEEEHYFDKESFIDTFKKCTALVRKDTIEYYEINYIDFAKL